MTKRSLALLAVCLLVPAGLAPADDWPQFRGPDRSGCSAEKGLLQQWPEGGPKLLWTCKEAGVGYSGPAVVGDRLYTLGARGDTTYVLCLDARTGKEVWHRELGRKFTFKNNRWGDGPRGTPTVDGKLLYALGGFGDLVCLQTEDGKEVWRKNLPKDLGGRMMTSWGYSESPLVDGDNLVCCPGGPQGTLAALDKKTGKVVWRSKGLKDSATYASLRVAELGGVRQYVALTFDGFAEEEGSAATGAAAVAGVEAANGRRLWYQPFFKGASYEIAPTPLVPSGMVYVTAESAGCQLFQLTPAGTKVVVKGLYTGRARKVMDSWHGGVVRVGKHVYGHSHGKGWICQDLKTGKVAWQERAKLEGASGSLAYGDGRLYLLSDLGELALVKAAPEGWDETGRLKLPEESKLRAPSGGVWTHPVIAGGRLYLRDQELLFCYDIRAAK